MKKVNNEFHCKLCEKYYKSINSLCNHNRKFHKKNEPKNNQNEHFSENTEPKPNSCGLLPRSVSDDMSTLIDISEFKPDECTLIISISRQRLLRFRQVRLATLIQTELLNELAYVDQKTEHSLS